MFVNRIARAFALFCGLVLALTAAAAPHLVVPEHGAYTGAYMDFGEAEDKVTLEAIQGFEALVGKAQSIVAFSSFWGERRFPLREIRIVDGYGAVPLIFWSPWDRPYEQPGSQGPFGLERILAGEHDAYIDAWATQAAAWGRPLLVGWGIEMNGNWFPWSGAFYGGGNPAEGGGWQGPETFKRAYRYVVDRVRAQGATNVQWVFHLNHNSIPTEPWNAIANYYPGPDYVDWLGMSAYGKQFGDQEWKGFDGVFPYAYEAITALDPTKPFILAEWGVGEFPAAGDKGAWIGEALRRFETEFPRLKAAVYWHERWQNGDLTYSNLRIHSSEGSLNAYREGVKGPYWLDRPVIAP